MIRIPIVAITMIGLCFGPFHHVFVLHSTWKMLLVFGAVVNFIVMLIWNKLCYSAKVLVYYNCIKVYKPNISR